MKGVQAPPQVGEVPGQTHPFEIGIEGPFGNGVIGESIQNFFRDGFSLGQMDDLHGSPSTAYPKRRISKAGDSAYLYTPHLAKFKSLYVSRSNERLFIRFSL